MVDSINLYSKEDIIHKLKVDSLSLDEWEKSGLLIPAGRNEKNIPYYSEENVAQAEVIKSLLSLGYDIESIKQIESKVGLPKRIDKKDKLYGKLLTIGEIAEKSGISARTLKYWEEKELIKPDSRSSGGFRLYRESFVETCQRIKELQLFGYTVEELKNMSLLLIPEERLREELDSYKEEEKKKIVDKFIEQQSTLAQKVEELKKAIKRWEKIIKSQSRNIAPFKS